MSQINGKTISVTLINVTTWSGGFSKYSGRSSPVLLSADQPILLELSHCNSWGTGYAKVSFSCSVNPSHSSEFRFPYFYKYIHLILLFSLPCQFPAQRPSSSVAQTSNRSTSQPPSHGSSSPSGFLLEHRMSPGSTST